MAKDAIKAIELTSFNSAGANATYQVINSNGLDEACTQIIIVNDSNIDILISLDGSTDHIFMPANVQFSLPVQSNNQPQNRRQMFPKGMKFYVESVSGAAGVGLIYLSGFYSDPS